MLPALAQRCIERRESDEEGTDFPHRVFDSLRGTFPVGLIGHGPRDGV